MLLTPPSTPAKEASGICLWANCDEPTASWRWGGPKAMKWIPVCNEHRSKTQAERVQELADEFRRLAAQHRLEADEEKVGLGLIGIHYGKAGAFEQAAQMLEERLNG